MVKIVDVLELVELNGREGLLTPEELGKKETTKLHPSRFFGHALFQYDDDLALVKRYFKDQLVVDIGSGTDISAYRACCIAGARGYIGVDCANSYDANLRANLLSEEKWAKHDAEFKFLGERLKHMRDVPVALVYEKAQKFLRRLPNNSVSIYAGGIDVCMIPSDKEARELEEQIVRVLNSNGAFISHCTRLFKSCHQGDIPVEGLTLVDATDSYPPRYVRIK